MVSNEGETRLLGFEVAPALREVATSGRSARAVAPLPRARSARRRRPPARPTTSTPWAPSSSSCSPASACRLPRADGYGDDRSTSADRSPTRARRCPPELATCSSAASAPRDQRIGDAVTWHKTLSQADVRRPVQPDDLQPRLLHAQPLPRRDRAREPGDRRREDDWICVERRPRRPAAAAPAPCRSAGAADAAREETGVRDGPPRHSGTRAPGARASRPRRGCVIGIAAVGPRRCSAAAATSCSAVGQATPRHARRRRTRRDAPAPGGTPAAAPAGPTPEEIQAQIQKIVRRPQQEMEQAQGAVRRPLKQLQKQLEDAKKAQAAGGPPRRRSPGGTRRRPRRRRSEPATPTPRAGAGRRTSTARPAPPTAAPATVDAAGRPPPAGAAARRHPAAARPRRRSSSATWCSPGPA